MEPNQIIDDLPAANDELIDVPMFFDKETGDPTHGFKVVGANSDRYQAAERAWQQKAFRKAAHRGRNVNVASEEGAAELADALRAQERALVCASIVSIYGFTVGGAPMELNQESLDRLFAARPTWIGKLLAEIRAERVFTKP